MRKIFCMVSLVILMFWMMPSGALAKEKEAAKEKEIPSVVARVNGKEITADQYRNQWHILHRMRVSSGQRIEINPEYEKSMKKDVVDRLIALELLRQEAVKKNLQADPLKVEEKVRELTDRMGAAGAMASAFSGQKPDLNAYRADITNSMNTQGLLKQEVYDKVTVAPKEVEDYYKANIKNFEIPDQVRARHIFIRIQDDAAGAGGNDALKAIQMAAERIQKGEAFEKVAKEVSQDGSASAGGDLGYFGRGRMVPEFEKVAFSLEKGQVSDIVKTRFGYHLIRVDDMRSAGIKPLNEVAPEIEALLGRQKAESLGKDYIEKLRAEAEIEKVPF